MADFTYGVVGKADLDQLSAELKGLRGDMARMSTETKKSGAEASKAFQAMQQSVGSALRLAQGALVAFVGAKGLGLVISTLRDLVSEGAAAGAQVRQMGQALGLSTEEFSDAATALGELGFAADEAFDVLGEISQRAVNNAADFQRWGISTRDANGQFVGSIALLERMADRTASLQGATQRMALADELLSDAGRRLVPVLRGGGQAIRDMMEQARAAGTMVTEYEGRVGEGLVRRQRIAEIQTRALASAVSGALGPALIAAQQSLSGIRTRITEWVRANQDLIGSKVDEYIGTLSDVWLPRVAEALILGSRVVRGYGLTWTALQITVSKSIALLAAGSAKLFELGAAIESFRGNDKLAAGFRAASKDWIALGSAAAEGAAEYGREFDAAIEKQVELEGAIRSFAVGGQAALASFRAAFQRLRADLKTGTDEAGDGLRKLGDEAEVAATRALAQAQRFASFMAGIRALTQPAVKTALEYGEALERVKVQEGLAQTAAEERAAAIRDHFAAAMSMTAGFIRQAIDGQLTFGAVASQVGDLLIGKVTEYLAGLISAKLTEAAITTATAKTAVAANAATAASGAAASQSAIPIVGPVLAIAAMGAIFAAVMAMQQGFNRGGLVGGGGANRDSVRALLTPGELVIDRETTQRLAALLGGGSAPAPRNAGPAVSMGPASAPRVSGGAGGTMVLQVLSLPESRIEQTRLARRHARLLDRA